MPWTNFIRSQNISTALYPKEGMTRSTKPFTSWPVNRLNLYQRIFHMANFLYSWPPILQVCIQPETTVYSDRLLLHYPPISDAFDNIENFFCIKRMIQLWHYWEIACSITKKIFHCYKKHLKWGDEVMKKVSLIIQCSMIQPNKCQNL